MKAFLTPEVLHKATGGAALETGVYPIAALLKRLPFDSFLYRSVFVIGVFVKYFI